MTIDVQSLRGAVRELKAEMAALHRRVEAVELLLAHADDADATSPGTEPAAFAVQLPPEIVVARPDAVADYLRTRPGLTSIVREMGQALLDEFAGEAARLLLTLDQDEHVDAHFLTYTLRLPEYSRDSDVVDRLEQIAAAYDGRLTLADGWVIATTDFEPAERA